MKHTIVVGTIEFLNRKAIIHDIVEVYHAGSKEEQDALEDTFNQEGLDYLTIEKYQGNIEVKKELLTKLLIN
jgi:hypothetical protein